MKKTDKIKAKLAIAWLKRAEGKSSHFGFNGCIDTAIDILKGIPNNPKWLEILDGVGLHHHRRITEVKMGIKEMYNIDDEEYKMIGSSRPDIDYLLEELEMVLDD